MIAVAIAILQLFLSPHIISHFRRYRLRVLQLILSRFIQLARRAAMERRPYRCGHAGPPALGIPHAKRGEYQFDAFLETDILAVLERSSISIFTPGM